MWKERIIIDPNILEGKPIIKGTNISVEHILELLAKGWSFDQILENLPQLKNEDIMAIIQYSFEIADLCIRGEYSSDYSYNQLQNEGCKVSVPLQKNQRINKKRESNELKGKVRDSKRRG